MLEEGASLSKEEILDFLAPKVAKWQLPDDVVFIDEVPKTSVGKFSKKTLRDRFADVPTETAAQLDVDRFISTSIWVGAAAVGGGRKTGDTVSRCVAEYPPPPGTPSGGAHHRVERGGPQAPKRT